MLSTKIITRVRGEFPPNAVDLALAYLSCYGTASWHSERERVHAAALDLAAGDLDRLMKVIERADGEYRSVLAKAQRD